MRTTPTVALLPEDDILRDIVDNKVVRFTPSELVNDVYKTNHSVKYVINGYEEYIIEGKREKLLCGETLLINAERLVSAQSCGEAIAIFLEDDLISDITLTFFGDGQAQNYLQGFEDVERVDGRSFEGIWRQLLDVNDITLTEEFYYEVAATYITSFMRKIDGGNRLRSREAECISIDRLQIARSFIFDNITTKVTLENVAKEAAISKFHLLRSFKKHYGLTPLRLHRWLRLNRAKALLRSEHHSISEVAYLMDYPDLPSFSKQFKQENNVSPSFFLENGS
ncbi:MAG: AraC family transcriptional regulator [Cyclobacteriaceae bacterium]